jgi:hypothetical protein
MILRISVAVKYTLTKVVSRGGQGYDRLIFLDGTAANSDVSPLWESIDMFGRLTRFSTADRTSSAGQYSLDWRLSSTAFAFWTIHSVRRYGKLFSGASHGIPEAYHDLSSERTATLHDGIAEFMVNHCSIIFEISQLRY